ncbi:MAG: helix-turn-helix domain-containing protein [Planctomycetota bacterium]|nr:helix-turn-helix domain-containing protein [Planctomycetota bacterium]
MENAEGKDAGRERRKETEAPDKPADDVERFPKIYTARDVANILKLDIGTVYRKLRNGALPEPLPFSKSMRWNGWHFDKWIDEGCPPPERAGKRVKSQKGGEKTERRRSAARKKPKGGARDGNGQQHNQSFDA